MASRSRCRRLPSTHSLGAAGLPRPVPKTKQLRNLESMFTVSECLAQLLSAASIDLPAANLPRGARLRKYRDMRAGRGCSSGSDMHAGAPVTIAPIGNSTTADRLRTCPRASDVGNTLNFTLKFHKK